MIAAVVYSVWLVEPFLPARLSALTSYVSEYGARDQPYRWFFRSTDIAAGLLFLLASIPLSRVLPPGWPWRALMIGLPLYGLSTIAVAVFPMDCATSVNAACRSAEQAGELSAAHYAHTVFSVSAFIGSALAALAAERMTQGKASLLFRIVLVLLIVTGVLSVLLYSQPGAGLAQRIQLLVVAVALLTGATLLLRADRSGSSV
ncbi:DUF998 domain-containing protein [Longimycelium tulufanense]|uniref:DUF998 domain-containing protein n=1 Tax=Longimycelium tulufanense TaxID=907463 RepID=UPI001669E472|nr:DUF998 domain-containing protein [Longimycelium tulufanense]